MNQPATLTVAHTSTVTSDQIDDLGHMNVRYYGQNAHHATVEMMGRLGVSRAPIVSTYTRHHHEQLEGSRLEVRSGVLGGSPRLRLYHELRNRSDGGLAATFVHELDHPQLELPVLGLPEHGQSRSISLDADRLSTAPSLAWVQSEGLAIRRPRPVDPEDSDGAESVPVWLANNLIWGGETIDGDGEWIVTASDGDRVAFATMESRLWIKRLPTVGTNVESFGAVIDLGDKIAHELNWVYDIDKGDVLAVMEVVDLAFSITNRCSRPMTPEQRARQQSRFRPELA